MKLRFTGNINTNINQKREKVSTICLPGVFLSLVLIVKANRRRDQNTYREFLVTFFIPELTPRTQALS